MVFSIVYIILKYFNFNVLIYYDYLIFKVINISLINFYLINILNKNLIVSLIYIQYIKIKIGFIPQKYLCMINDFIFINIYMIVLLADFILWNILI